MERLEGVLVRFSFSFIAYSIFRFIPPPPFFGFGASLVDGVWGLNVSVRMPGDEVVLVSYSCVCLTLLGCEGEERS